MHFSREQRKVVQMDSAMKCVPQTEKGTFATLSHVRLSVTLWTVAHQAPLSLGILQARILGCIAIPFSRGSSRPRDETQVSYIVYTGKQVVYPGATWEA